MERTVTIHAVNIVTTENVTDLMEVVLLVVPTDFMASGAKEVNIIKIVEGLTTFTIKYTLLFVD